MALVYPCRAPVTISKKSPLIRILSKGMDCIDYGDFVNGRGKGPLVKGGCPRERTGGFRRAAREDGAARMRPGRDEALRGVVGGGVPDAPRRLAAARTAREGGIPPLRGERSTGGNGKAAGRACPAPTGRRFAGSYLSIRHACKLLVISPWMRVDTRSTRAAGSAFMPVRTHSSVRPTKAYL